MSLQDIFNIVRSTDRSTTASSPDEVLLGHVNKLHAQWQHEQFPDIMQVRAPLELTDTPPTVVENFRMALGISELDWIHVNGVGALPRRNSQYSRPRPLVEYSARDYYYIVEGLRLTVHAAGDAEVRGQRMLPVNLNTESLSTHTNPLLEVHPNLYITGLLYQESVSSRAAQDELALAAGAYNAALEGVRGAEQTQRIALP